MTATKFNRSGNQGTKVCEYCGKRTWAERIDAGMCERCSTIFGYDNTLADSRPDSKDAKQAVAAIQAALKMPDFPPFIDKGFFNSRTTERLVKERNQEVA